MGYQNFYTSRITTDIGTSDTTITVETPPTETSGRLALEARNTTQRELISYTGVSGNDLTGVTRGIGGTSAKTHLRNSLVEMNLTAEDIADLYDAYDSFVASNSNGWVELLETLVVASGYNKGNKSFELTCAGEDLTDRLNEGMKLRLGRSIAAPDQCLDLEASSSQYASKSSPSGFAWTDDFTVEAHVQPESFSSSMMIASRHDGSTGFWLSLTDSGRVVLRAQSGAGAREVTSYQSIPLGRKSHVAASWDLSAGTAAIYIDGVLVPSANSGTAITSLTQAGNLMIGNSGVTAYYDGKVSEVRFWSSVRTATQIKDNAYQQLVGNAATLASNYPTLVAYYKLDGDLNDSTSNANHMTGSGGAVATADSDFMQDIEYGYITKIEYTGGDTTITLFTGTDHVVPNMTIEDVYYSNRVAPYGFPTSRSKWRVTSWINYDYAGIPFGSTGQWTGSQFALTVPQGSWKIGYKGNFNLASNVSGTRDGHFCMAASGELTNVVYRNNPLVAWTYRTGTPDAPEYLNLHDHRTVTAPTSYYIYADVASATGSESFQIRGANGLTEMYAECNYI